MVKKSFSKAIIHNRTLAKDKEDLILVFMLSNIEDVFKVRPKRLVCRSVVANPGVFPSPGTQSSAQRRE